MLFLPVCLPNSAGTARLTMDYIDVKPPGAFPEQGFRELAKSIGVISHVGCGTTSPGRIMSPRDTEREREREERERERERERGGGRQNKKRVG